MTKEILLTQGKVAIVDDEDYELVSQWTWSANHSKKRWYAIRKQLPRHMHTLIMGSPKGLDVDHKDRNGLNNVRSNLRLATRSQNMMNHGKQSNNVSGYKGVIWDKEREKWRAQTKTNGKFIVIGRYKTAEEAARAYDKFVRTIFGDFAWINFP